MMTRQQQKLTRSSKSWVGEMGIPGLTLLKRHERSVILRVGPLLRVAGPGLGFHIPFVDGIIVVNLDQSNPGWLGIPEERLREYTKFLALAYPIIPENPSVSDIEIDMRRGEERDKAIEQAVSLAREGQRNEAIKILSKEWRLDVKETEVALDHYLKVLDDLEGG